MIEPDEFANWMEHPVTKKYIQYLKDVTIAHQDELLNVTNSTIDHPLMLIGNFGGRIYICDELSKITYDVINEFYDEPEPKKDEDSPLISGEL